MKRFAPERLLPLAVIGGAVLLIAGELSDTFRFDGAGAVTLATSGGGDRHHYALLVLGLFAIGSLVIAIVAGSKPAAIAVAVAGFTALLIFLIVDLPDVDKVGTFDDPVQAFLQAKAQPEDGFWIELIGALVLTVCGGAMATLTGEQLRALRPGASAKSRESLPSNQPVDESTWADADRKPAADRGAAPKKRLRALPKTKQARSQRKTESPAWGADRGKGSAKGRTDGPAETGGERPTKGRSAEPAKPSDKPAPKTAGKGKPTPKPAEKGKPAPKPADNGRPKQKTKRDSDDGEEGSGEKRDVYQR